MNFDVSIFIITSDRQYIPADEYNAMCDGEGMFVILTNDELNREFGDNNTICLYRGWLDAVKKTKDRFASHIKFVDNIYGYVACQWQIESREIPNTFKLNRDTDEIEDDMIEMNKCARKYIDGYRANKEVMRNVTSLLKGKSIEEYLPAIMVAHHTQVTFNDRTINGYLPAIGQLRIIYDNIVEVNEAFGKIGSGKIVPNNNGWWSVTEYNYSHVWFSDNETTYYTYKRASTLQVLPLFVI